VKSKGRYVVKVKKVSKKGKQFDGFWWKIKGLSRVLMKALEKEGSV